MKSAWLEYSYLLIAIFSEVLGTSALNASQEFTRLTPSLLVVLGYGLSFYFLGLSLRVIPVGVAYAIWSGLGIVLITASAAFFFDQRPDWPALIGMGLIVAGVLVLQLFSEMTVH